MYHTIEFNNVDFGVPKKEGPKEERLPSPKPGKQ